MWKVFLVIALVTMIGAGGLSYVNMGEAEKKRNARIESQTILAKREQELKNTQDQLAAANASIAKLKVETEELEGQLVQKKAMVTEAEAKLQGLNTQLAAAKVELDKAQEFEREFPNIELIKQEMAQIRQEIDQLGIEITALQNNVATAEIQRDNLQKTADELEELKTNQNRGLITGPFASRVKKAYNNWGFVILEGGNEQGVVDRAQLDVIRSGKPVAKVVVVTVEPGESVAEVIPGTMAQGQSVRAGDIVRKSENQLDLPDDNANPLIPTVEGGADPAAGGAPVADPFGGGGATVDPFGGGGGAMEAPAGETPAALAEPDPFGGGGGGAAMPEAGGAEAPAPAPGGAEAPAPAPGGAEPDPFQ